MGLAIALALAFAVVSSGVPISGTIRDFTKSSTDFNVASSNADSTVSFVQTILDAYTTRPNRLATATTTTVANFSNWFSTSHASSFNKLTYAANFAAVGNVLEFASDAFWPIDGRGLGNEGDANNRYFTFELAVRFTHVAGITLNFASADDMWVFVDNRLVADLGGIHTKMTKSVDLDFYSLTLGTKYMLRVFFAHRSQFNTPQIRVQVPSALDCSVRTAGLMNSNIGPLVASNYALSGAGMVMSDNQLRLTSVTGPSQATAVWNNQLRQLATGFTVDFNFRVARSGTRAAEGFAFVIQSNGLNARGDASANLAYNFPGNLAVEFDMFNNAGFDLDDNHIEVHVNGYSTTASNSADKAYAIALTPAQTVYFTQRMDDGAVHPVRIQYIPTEALMYIWLDKVLVRTVPINPTKLNDMFIPNGQGYIGFTASTSSTNFADIFVTDLVFNTLPVSSGYSTYVGATNWQTAVASNLAPTTSQLTVTARDACNNLVTVGGDSISASLRHPTLGLVSPATTVADRLGGRYSAGFYYTSAVNGYLFRVMLNGQDLFDSPFTVNISPAGVASATTTFSGVALNELITAGSTRTITITTKDAFGNLNSAGTAASLLRARFASTAEFAATYTGGAAYSIPMVATVAGPDAVYIRYNGVDIQGSPINPVVIAPSNPTGTNSTLEGAGLVNAVAGVNTSFIIRLRDLYGNTVQQQTPVTCTLTSGANSAATFVAFTAKTSTADAFYTCSYNATFSGTYTIATFVSGTKITASDVYKPFVDTATVSAARSQVQLSNPSFVAGDSNSFFVQAVDIYGNTRLRVNDAGEFSVTVTDGGSNTVTASCAAGSAATSNSIISSMQCAYDSAGRYKVTVVPRKAVTYTATARLSTDASVLVGGTSKTFTVVPASADSTQSTLTTPIASIAAGATGSFVFTVRDRFGNVRSSTNDASLVDVTIRAKNGQNFVGTPRTLTPSSGVYTQTWTGTTASTYTVSVNLGGQPIVGSGADAVINSDVTRASNCTLSGAGLDGGVANSNLTFAILARDLYGNSRSSTSDNFTVVVIPGNRPSYSGSVINTGAGQYQATYTVPQYFAQFTNFTLRVLFTPAGGSAQLVSNVLAYTYQNSAQSFANATGAGLTSAVAGDVTSFYITDYDSAGGVITTQNSRFSVNIQSIATAAKIPASVTWEQANTRYRVDYVITKSDNYNVRIYANGAETPQSSSRGGFNLVVRAGAVNGPNSFVVGFPVTVVAGTVTTYRIFTKDVYGNLITTGGLSVLPVFPFTATPNITDNSDGSYTVSYRPTLVGTFSAIYTRLANDASVILGDSDNRLTVLAGSVAPSRLIVNGALVAGRAGTVTVLAQDAYFNDVDNATLSFTVSLESNTGLVATTNFVSAGRYDVMFTPTVSNTARPLTINVLVGSQLINSTSIVVQPGAVSDAQSSVAGLSNPSYTASRPVTFTLTARDANNNQWFNDKLVRAEATGPINNPNIIGVNQGNGVYSFSFIPTKSGLYNMKLYTPDGVLSPSGLNAITVVADVPSAANTDIQSFFGVTFDVGQLRTLTINLRDANLNKITVGGASVTLTFLDGLVPRCIGSTVDSAYNLTRNFDFSTAVDNGDGTYTARLTTRVMGLYSMAVYVNGQPTRTCSQIRVSFTTTALAVNTTGSTFSTNATAVAGDTLPLTVQMRDMYGNQVSAIQPIVVGTAPIGLPGFCSDVPTANWIAIDTASFSVTGDGQSTAYYRVTASGTYALVVTIGGSLVGGSSTCRKLVVGPGPITQFRRGTLSNWTAATPFSFNIFSLDLFNNPVKPSGTNVFRVTFRRNEDSLKRGAVVVSTVSRALTDSHIVEYTLAWPGSYDVIAEMYADSSLATRLLANAPFSVTVNPASCAQYDASMPFRCPDGSCAASYADCGLPTNCPVRCAIDSTCRPSGSDCTCPVASPFKCAAGYCVASASDCPPSLFVACAAPTPFRCASGECRSSATECPSARVCPPSFLLCADLATCVRNATECPTTLATSCNPGFSRCRDGSCVRNAESCPTDKTCALFDTDSQSFFPGVVCADGSCRNNSIQCPDVAQCFAPNSFRCQDGSCRASAADCPSNIVCPIGYSLCDDGQCRMSVRECGPQRACFYNTTRCPDGSCRASLSLCPTRPSCPTTSPILCADGSCAPVLSLCKRPANCPLEKPVACPDGSCASSFAGCPSQITCPTSAPVLCRDGTCAATVASCSSITVTCPNDAPVRCADGSCRFNLAQCPSLIACPADIPVRCPDGSCAATVHLCSSLSLLDCSRFGPNWVRCSGGQCAPHRSACAATVSCPLDMRRCIDGTCRTDCSVIPVVNELVQSPCIDPAMPVVCPRDHQGVTCAADISQCPQAISCPRDSPVRCPDFSCATSIAECPPSPQYSLARKACPAGWASKVACGASVTCPVSRPAKCWDETCRVVAEDCPPKPRCPSSSPYVCPDGNCYPNIYQCPNTKICPATTPVYCGVNDACVSDVARCPAWNATDLTYECPNRGVRCKNGACVDESFNCPENLCPTHLPYRCANGLCAVSGDACYNDAGCPADEPVKCGDGSCRTSTDLCPRMTLKQGDACPQPDPSNPDPRIVGKFYCEDGSCADTVRDCPMKNGCPTSRILCLDKVCVTPSGTGATGNPCINTDSTANACPMARPYQCPDGYCAISSTACPVFPNATSEPCGFTRSGQPKFIRCADGTCVQSSEQCPILRPCDPRTQRGFVRCGDGSCRRDKYSCPMANTCPLLFPDRPIRCANGLCVSLSSMCPDDLGNGCPPYHVKCTNGLCASASMYCSSWAPDFPLGNGCPASTPFKCANGACASSWDSCTLANGCPASSPIRCGDGSCQASSGTCPAAGTQCSGVVCPATGLCAPAFANCTTADGCPVDRPFRCANGDCAKFPASVKGPDSCPVTMLCPADLPFMCADGACVASSQLCRPVQPCPVPNFRACPGVSLTCVLNGDTCPAQNSCPLSAPVICPNGACAASIRECTAVGNTCPADKPVECFDGSCGRSPVDCADVASRYRLAQPYNPTSDANAVCPAGSTLCFDGNCAPSGARCPPTPRCPAVAPLRCADGSCAGRGKTCPVVAACAAGLTRCEDGTCRARCPAFDGCPLSKPFYCPGRKAQCFADEASCGTSGMSPMRRLLAATQEVCSTNCERDNMALDQTVSVAVTTSVRVDISLDQNNVPRTQLVLPSGALGKPASISVAPVPFTAATGQNSLYTEKVLSTPFMCSTDGADPAFVLNGTVTAYVDLQLYNGGSDSGAGGSSTSSAVPCEWQADLSAETQLNTGYTCTGDVSFSQDSVAFDMNACDDYDWDGKLSSLKTIKAWDSRTTQSIQCMCFQLTRSSNATATTVGDVGTTICGLFKRNLDQYFAFFNADASVSVQCPAETVRVGDPNIRSYSFRRQVGRADACTSSSGSGQSSQTIAAQDICLGYLPLSGGDWRCVDESRDERLSNPVWTDKSGRAQNLVQSRLSSCRGGSVAYAFIYSALPPPVLVPEPGKSFWQKYGTIIIASVASFVGFSLIMVYVLWRFRRYRDKYKKTTQEIHDRQFELQQLDEMGTGIGIAGDDMVMTLNPMVAQMQSVTAKLQEVNAQLNTKEELDRLEKDRLDRERKNLMEEIERLKTQMAKQQSGPSRTDINTIRGAGPMPYAMPLTDTFAPPPPPASFGDTAPPPPPPSMSTSDAVPVSGAGGFTPISPVAAAPAPFIAPAIASPVAAQQFAPQAKKKQREL